MPSRRPTATRFAPMTPTSDNRAPYLVALMGFGGFEQQALDAYLKLARSRSPAYAPCEELGDAQFVIANGDRGGVLDLLAAAQRTGDTVLVADSAVPGVAALLSRPIDPQALFRTLDDAVRRRSLAATAARAGPGAMTMAEIATAWSANEGDHRSSFFAPPSLLAPLAPDVVERHAPAWADAPVDLPGQIEPAGARDVLGTASRLRREAEEAPSTATRTLHALVVGGDTTPLSSLLESQNVKATCVGRAHHAFAMLDAFAFDVVAIDVDLGDEGDLDGLQVCQTIRRQPRPPGESCPPILLLSAQPTPLEHARAALAGGSAYLSTPLQPWELARALADAGLRSQDAPLAGLSGAA